MFSVHHHDVIRSRSIAGENQYTVSVSPTGNIAHVVRSPLPRKHPVK